jgi:hypothetical protein
MHTYDYLSAALQAQLVGGFLVLLAAVLLLALVLFVVEQRRLGAPRRRQRQRADQRARYLAKQRKQARGRF